jgi:hypothetical protein
MSEKKDYQVVLKERQFQFLSDMVKKYNISNESKALRCLLNYAMEQADKEQAIFRQIRCFDC